MRALFLGLPLCVLLLAGCYSQPRAEGTDSKYKNLVWSDEFEGTELNLEKWRPMIGTGPEEGYPEFWGNNEKQFYRAENAIVRDRALAIQIKREDYGGMTYTSSRLTTSGLYSFTYGRAEARVKLPGGAEGLWPAFWLLPDGEPNEWAYGAWAASGEIDIMEYRSRQPGQVSGAAHFGGAWPVNSYDSGAYAFPENGGAEGWHTYSLEWSPESLIWYADGKEYFRLNDWYSIVNDRLYDKPAPFDKPFCLVINGAVGGNFDEGREPGEDFSAAEILVDWVRVYQ